MVKRKRVRRKKPFGLTKRSALTTARKIAKSHKGQVAVYRMKNKKYAVIMG